MRDIKRTFEGFLKVAVRTGKVEMGYRSTLSSLRSAKLVVYSRSLNPERLHELLEAAKANNTPVVEFDGTSIALGNACGRPFPVLALAIKSPGDADLDKFLEAVKDKVK